MNAVTAAGIGHGFADVSIAGSRLFRFDTMERVMFNPDNITVKASATNFAGNAQFVLRADGVRIGSVHDISASHSAGESESFSFATNLTGVKQLSIEFVNDFYVIYGSGFAFDRNMFVDSLTVNGQSYPGSSLTPSAEAHTRIVGNSTALERSGPVLFNINGYKGADTINKMAFGFEGHNPSTNAGQVYAIYDSVLGRAPDPFGLEGWTLALNNGASLRGVAQASIGSAEGQARLGAQDNAIFVEQLYQSTLHRHSDQVGLASWTAQLNAGTSRADVALGFALSPEHITNLSSAYDTGFFVPDAVSASVARLYYAVLGRAPDAAGLSGWSGQVNKGMPLSSVSQAFLSSPEAATKLGALTDAQYVDTLYVNALGRHTDSLGLSYWADQLSHGTSRANVASQIGQGVESQMHHLSDIEAGWHIL